MSMQRKRAISAIRASARWQMAIDAAQQGLLGHSEDGTPALTPEEIRQRLSDTGTGTPLLTPVPSRHRGKRGLAKDLAVIWDMLTSTWINVLLVAIPLGFASEWMGWGAVATFSLNFLGLIPLALILGDITEDLALRFGDVIGGLLNATFGNVVEVILSIAALTKGLYTVTAASLLGSILSNLLLVLGCCMLFGGLYFKTQSFNAVSNRACSSLLFLAVIGIITPTAAYQLVHGQNEQRDQWILDISRISAVVLLIIYASYLTFQLVTHHDLFSGEDEGGEEPQLSTFSSMACLTAITVLVAFSSEFLTGSIEEVSKSTGLGEAFLGMIVLPIAGNACEHITAVIVAMKNKMDLALGVAMGSSLQIALFALPLCVVVGWFTGHPFSLNLDPFMALVLTASVIHANFITNDATSHWLLGVQLVAVYFIIAAAYFYQ